MPVKKAMLPEGEGRWPGADAKLRLILAAEDLIGRNGVADSSLREISRYSGHGNVGAAQYHFGDKESLLAAVMQYRRPVLDSQRRELAEQRGLNLQSSPVGPLIALINDSLFHQDGENGVRSFARFLRGIESEDIFSPLWLGADRTAPFTGEIYAAMRAKVPRLSDEMWELRRRQLGLFTTSNIANFDRYQHRLRLTEGEFLDDLNRITAAALTA